MVSDVESETLEVTHRIVTKVAEAESVSPTRLPPLEEVIDTDSVDSLFSSCPKTSMELRFEYLEYVVIVGEYGQVTLEEL